MRLASLLCYAFAVGLAVYYWGPVVDAKWGLIDDHEVMFFVGPDDHMPVSRLPVVVEQIELSPQSTLPRFRPSYYGLRLAEALAWGKNPALWFGFRLVVAVVFMAAVAHVCLQAVGPILTL